MEIINRDILFKVILWLNMTCPVYYICATRNILQRYRNPVSKLFSKKLFNPRLGHQSLPNRFILFWAMHIFGSTNSTNITISFHRLINSRHFCVVVLHNIQITTSSVFFLRIILKSFIIMTFYFSLKKLPLIGAGVINECFSCFAMLMTLVSQGS